MVITGIDPGTTESGVAIVSFDPVALVYCEKIENSKVADTALASGADHVVCEAMTNGGTPVGGEVYKTLMWIGRFSAELEARGVFLRAIYRRTIMSVLTGVAKGGDPDIRRAVLAAFPQTGGGKEPAKGIKSQPGPLFEVSGSDQYAAIAVCLAAHKKGVGAIHGFFGSQPGWVDDVVSGAFGDDPEAKEAVVVGGKCRLESLYDGL